MALKAEPILQIPTILGEGPIWSVERQALVWLDIFRPAIHRYDPRTQDNVTLALDEPIYALGLREGGGFVGAMESGFAVGDFEAGVNEVIANPNAGQNVNFNDGKVDRGGRFWSGTMARDWESPLGVLYRFDGKEAVAVQDGLVLSNGLGWSPDDATMYHTDFKQSTIYAYDFDVAPGTLANRRPFITLAEGDGFPDGMTVDSEGCLWVAHWDGWCVTRHDPEGREMVRIEFPVPRPTCPAFGAEDMSILYVTSATMHLSSEQLAEAPLSGALFAVAAGVKGTPEPLFSG